MSLALSSLDDRIELRGLLGEGGMGEVHRAFDRRLERAVAVKLLRGSDPRDADRLLLEARLQARVEHPHVVKVHEVGTLGGRPCIVLQLVEGRPLSALAPSLPDAERIELVRQAALGLHAAHLQGLVHRDVKPGNVLVEEGEGGARRALVTDFGLARGEEGGLTRSGLPAGTLDFMSPEQLLGAGPVDFRADVWGLGATLYAILSGAPPFRPSGPAGSEDPASLLRRILEEEPPPLRTAAPRAPREIALVAAKAMEKDPAARYASAEALAEDLGRIQRGEPVRARPAAPAERAVKWARRNRTAARALAVAAVALALAGGWTLWRSRRAGFEALEAARLGAVAASLEARMRMEHLSPAHDLRPALAGVRADVDELRARARDSGPASFALGKGLELLGDLDGARAAYEQAWTLGLDTPPVAEGRGAVLARLYDRAAANVSPTLTGEARDRQLAPIQREFRDPALRFLGMAEQGGWRGPYLRGQMALLEQRFADARARAGEALAAEPGRYEARVLEAEAWLREGRIELNRFGHAAAEPALRRAVAGLEGALAFGRSDPKIFELLSLCHSLLAIGLQRVGRDPGPEADAALSWAERGSAIHPDAPAFLVTKGKALESRAMRALETSPAAAIPLLEEADRLYVRAAERDAGSAEPLGQLAYVRYVRAALLRQLGRPSGDVLRAGIEAAADAARLAPSDDYPTFLAAVLRTEEADQLQSERRDASEPLRLAAEAGEKLLASSEAAASQGHAIAAKAYVGLALEDWLGGRDPRGAFERAFEHLEARVAKRGDDPEPVNALLEAAAVAAWRLDAMGEDSGPRVARARAAAAAVLSRSPGLALTRLDEARLIAFAAHRSARGGSDPRADAAEAARRLAGAKEFAEQADVQEELAALPLAEATWRVAAGGNPAVPLALAERRAAAVLRARPASTGALVTLSSAALLRSRWLRSTGRTGPAAAEARRALPFAEKLVTLERPDPEAWVLRARLLARAGEPAMARESLARAATLQPLVTGGFEYRTAEGELAASGR